MSQRRNTTSVVQVCGRSDSTTSPTARCRPRSSRPTATCRWSPGCSTTSASGPTPSRYCQLAKRWHGYLSRVPREPLRPLPPANECRY